MQFLVYILAYPLIWIISKFPFWLLYGVSDILYLFVYRIFGYRKKVVQANLNLVFPEKDQAEIKLITKKFYYHLCDMIVESIKSLSITEKELKIRYTFTNVDLIKTLEKENKSISLMIGHYGSWEWIFILQSYINHKGYAIYKPLANKYFDRLIKKIRAKYDSYLISTKEAFKIINEANKKGQLTINGFAADQSPKLNKKRYRSEFMGINVPMFTGAETMSKQLDLTVLFLDVQRVKRGFYQATFSFIAKNPKDYKDYEITDKYFTILENQIRRAPEYYLWTHKRWKHREFSEEI